MTAGDVQRVTFYFDPACPWTWRTSRWLIDVAGRARLTVDYRAFELSNAAPLDTVPEAYRAGATASRQFLRAVEKAHAAGADDLIGAVYRAYGTAVHDEGRGSSTDLLRETFSGSGAQEYLSALNDESLDPAVTAARAEAQQHAGDDIGSPVLLLTTPHGPRGFFGPVLAPTPTGDAADRLWDLVTSAAAVPQFFELKTRRTATP